MTKDFRLTIPVLGKVRYIAKNVRTELRTFKKKDNIMIFIY